jgi:hypothetical protein
MIHFFNNVKLCEIRISRTIISLIIVGSVNSVAFSHCAEDVEFDNTVKMMIESRRELKSGSFRAVGLFSQYDASSDTTIEMPREVECIFDDPTDRFRYVSKGQSLINLAPSTELTPDLLDQIQAKKYKGSPKPRNVSSLIVRNSEYSACWYSVGVPGEPNNSVRSHIHLDPKESSQFDPFSFYFPPSTAGLLNSPSLGVDTTIPKLFEYFDKFPPHTVRSVEEIGGDRLLLVYSSDRARREIEVNPERGYTVTRMAVIPIDQSGRPIDSDKVVDTEAEWEQMANVWVPVSHKTRRVLPSQNIITFQYSIEWKFVNLDSSGFNDEQFTYQSFDEVWDNVHVFDRRDGRIVHIDTIGAPFQQLSEERPVSANIDEVTGNRSHELLWLCLVNIGVVGFIWIFYRTRNRRADS